MFDCVHVFPDDDGDDELGCDSPFELRELADGPHTLRVDRHRRRRQRRTDGASR